MALSLTRTTTGTVSNPDANLNNNWTALRPAQWVRSLPKSWRRRESSEWNGSTKRLGRFFYRKFLPIRVILLSQVRFPAS
jgi:hypothetical protein